MKKIFSLLLVFNSLSAFSQNDTLITYLNDRWEKTTKDTAVYTSILYRTGNTYTWKQYAVKDQELQFEGIYADADRKTAVGDYRTYKNGKLYYKEQYHADGRRFSGTYYYPNGSKNGEIFWSGRNILQEKGWDEQGNEIKDFIVLREAQFKGGAEAWRQYLERKLKVQVAEQSGLPSGAYTAIVEFLVDKEGNVSEVRGTSPQHCGACVDEAVRIIQKGPKWIPAIMNNQPVIYRQKQSITFLVQ